MEENPDWGGREEQRPGKCGQQGKSEGNGDGLSREDNGREMRICSCEEEDNLIAVPSLVRMRSPEFKFLQERLM